MLKSSAKEFFIFMKSPGASIRLQNLKMIAPIVGLAFSLKIALISNDSWSHGVQATPEISVHGSKVNINLPSGKNQKITVDHEIEPNDVKFDDLTFSGNKDLKILKTRGASQEFYDVYLYSKKQGIYVFNKEMSDIPCLQVDAKRKQLVGACFHESSCENWEERYTVGARGSLSLIERRGTYCDPSGQTYSYIDRFKNGKQTSSEAIPLSSSNNQ